MAGAGDRYRRDRMGRQGAELGVGEILLNSMDADGTKTGFDLKMLAAARAAVTVPVIASGVPVRWGISHPRWKPGRMRCWRPAYFTSVT